MWGGGHEVLLDYKLHRNVKADVGLDVGSSFSKLVKLLKSNK